MEEKKELDLLTAVFLVHPKTQANALEAIPEEERIPVLIEAATMVAEAADRSIIIPAEKRQLGAWQCPICQTIYYTAQNFCKNCGQALDFDGHSKKVIALANSGIVLP